MRDFNKVHYESLQAEEVPNETINMKSTRERLPLFPPRAHALLIHATLLIIYTAVSIAIIRFERTNSSLDPQG